MPQDESITRFSRDRIRHRLTAREATVTAVTRPGGEMIRVTLSGQDFHDFVADGPEDHAKFFFPNPVTGELIAPTPLGPDEDGIVRPDAPVLQRDFTPLNLRVDVATGLSCFDVDFFQHPDPGPASAWAAQATVGDRLVVAGPRGSVTAPRDAARLVLAVDGTALPAALRWLADPATASADIEVLLDMPADDLAWAEEYLRSWSEREFTVFPVFGSLADAVADTGVDDGTFVFGAGEAGRLVPLRKLLKYELRLPREQYSLSGYWKQGQVNFDHHAPIDPEDPED